MSKANKIRTKLLLLIDQETLFKIRQKKLFYNLQNDVQKNNNLYSTINKKYSHQERAIFISFSKFEEQISINEIKLKKNLLNSQPLVSKCLASPVNGDVLFQNEDLKNISVLPENSIDKKKSRNYFLQCNNTININNNINSIKKIFNPSIFFQKHKKSITDKNYLRNLCNSLKLIKKQDLFFNAQIKYKLSDVIRNVNRGKSSSIKKPKKNLSCKKCINNFHL